MSSATAVDWTVTARAPDPCLVCGSLDARDVYASTYAGSVDQAATYFLANRTAAAHGRIVRCCACSFVFTSPRFSENEYDRIYKAVRPPIDLDPSFETAKIARFTRLASIVRKIQPREVALLDFGCGDGRFLRVLDSPSARGFEIGPEGKSMAGPSDVVTGDWADVAGSATYPPNSFDIVVAFDVLEHLPRIEEDLSLIRTVLKPNGLFFASVPNIESPVAKMLGKRWTMLLLEHLWYFSPKTLARLLERHGFEMLETRALPFDAPLAHVATRAAQTFGMQGTFKAGLLSRAVLPIPAGLMLCTFRKTG